MNTEGMAADDHRIKQRADAVLTLMSFMVVPDITASDLNIGTGTNENNELTITQFGGGATISDTFPIYLEGTLGYSRYDPKFVLSNGTDTRRIPTKWNSLSSVGVGLELDSSQYPVFITRTRLVARYMFGHDTSGYGIGLAMSF
ncbi:MAG: hypothetical protein LBE93_03650 [Enterobacter asburiae]|nr:hypothetical protein [Enterobacter asburiae]